MYIHAKYWLRVTKVTETFTGHDMGGPDTHEKIHHPENDRVQTAEDYMPVKTVSNLEEAWNSDDQLLGKLKYNVMWMALTDYRLSPRVNLLSDSNCWLRASDLKVTVEFELLRTMYTLHSGIIDREHDDLIDYDYDATWNWTIKPEEA